MEKKNFPISWKLVRTFMLQVFDASDWTSRFLYTGRLTLRLPRPVPFFSRAPARSPPFFLLRRVFLCVSKRTPRSPLHRDEACTHVSLHLTETGAVYPNWVYPPLLCADAVIFSPRTRSRVLIVFLLLISSPSMSSFSVDKQAQWRIVHCCCSSHGAAAVRWASTICLSLYRGLRKITKLWRWFVAHVNLHHSQLYITHLSA